MAKLKLLNFPYVYFHKSSAYKHSNSASALFLSIVAFSTIIKVMDMWKWGDFMRIAVMDGNAQQLTKLTEMLNTYSADNRITARITCFDSPWKLLDAVEGTGGFDLYLLDAQNHELDGIALISRLRKLENIGMVILLSESPDMAISAYGVRAFHYLLKPITPQALFPALDIAIAHLRGSGPDAFLVKTKEAIVRLYIDQVLYAELSSRTIRYHLTNGETLVSTTLRLPFPTMVEPLLRQDHFALCGASYAVNLRHIAAVKREHVTLTNGKSLQLPRGAHASLRTAWLNYWDASGMLQ